MAVSNAMQLGLGIVAACIVAITVVVVAPMLRPVADPVPESVETVQITPAETKTEVTIQLAPELDTFRVEGDGSTVIAGRAAPNQVIDILIGGASVERVTTDAGGSFVAFPKLPFSDDSQTITLIADPDTTAIVSAETYLIAPIVAPVIVTVENEDLISLIPSIIIDIPVPTPEVVKIVVAVIQADPNILDIADIIDAPKPIRDQIVVETVNTIPDAQQSSAFIDIPTPMPIPKTLPKSETLPVKTQAGAPAVLVVTAEGVKVIQPSLSDLPPDVLSNVALDSIIYDPGGNVLIAGRAVGREFVKVYLDNRPIMISPVVADGTWRTNLPDVYTGIYTLRIDEIDAMGDVVSRIETPFKREEPTVVEKAFAADVAKPEFQVAMTTVQPGSTLWAIARDRFGSGIMYVEVFEANRDRIRDPNLIYPGQVFRIPEDDR